MIVYHTSTTAIPDPSIQKQTRFLDYGSGFYTYTSEVQAASDVRSTIQNSRLEKKIVNVYEFDNARALEACKVLWLEKPDESWLDFIMDNRMGTCAPSCDDHSDAHSCLDEKKSYDLIFSLQPDDDLNIQFALYQDGVITKEQILEAAMDRLWLCKIVFASEKSLKFLKFARTLFDEGRNRENPQIESRQGPDPGKLKALLTIIVPHVIHLITEFEGLDEITAAKAFYSSKVYESLEIEQTKLWQLSPMMLFSMYEDEKGNSFDSYEPAGSKISTTGRFMIYCVEIYRHAKELSGKQASELFTRHDVWDYICNCYDALHTTGAQYIIHDIDGFIEDHPV